MQIFDFDIALYALVLTSDCKDVNQIVHSYIWRMCLNGVQ